VLVVGGEMIDNRGTSWDIGNHIGSLRGESNENP
jgi:hypothetical protein